MRADGRQAIHAQLKESGVHLILSSAIRSRDSAPLPLPDRLHARIRKRIHRMQFHSMGCNIARFFP